MKRTLFKIVLSIYLSISNTLGDSSASHFDRSTVLFGIEYTFQDAEIVKEEGRTTMYTDYKKAKMDQMLEEYLKIKGLQKRAIRYDGTHEYVKPGYEFHIPGEGLYVINMEPVTIEFNTTPKTIDQIMTVAPEIYQAAEKAGLVPYVNTAAERSGMGHIHVGGNTLGESPFYKHPNLLRNLLVYFHQHPSLLYGFAEAWDIGYGSNIENYYERNRFEGFIEAVNAFDQWYLEQLRTNNPKIEQGLSAFLRSLEHHQKFYRDFFDHYRFINLEHIKEILKGFGPTDRGKFTIEFRMFRPQKTPAHAQANAELILDLLEYLSKPGKLIPLNKPTSSDIERMQMPSSIESDWEKVKSEINHSNPLSDQMIEELTQNARETFELSIRRISGASLIQSFTAKGEKGTIYELRIPDTSSPLETKRPVLDINDHQIEFERVELKGEYFWTALINPKKLGITRSDFEERAKFLRVEKYKSEPHRIGGCLPGLKGIL